ncbi:tetratricopeptide repeat protein, partial [candidate division KSB1 bacterium]|nr:tetratricopeptide repeat protein [candidate division KSB1 bacterium]
MKTTITFIFPVVLAMLVFVSWRDAVAQSKSGEAINWFNVGVTESDVNKKITAYQKAIALDPSFVEAYYNLGILYRRHNNYENAEQFLNKALTVNPDRLKKDLKLQILYELASTQEKLGKNSEAEQNLRAAKSMANSNDVRTAMTLELGRLLIDQGRYGEAVAELRNGQSLGAASPRQQSEFQRLLGIAGTEIEMQRLLLAAEKAKSSGNLEEARKLLTQVKAKKPQDKTVDALLAAVEASEQAASRQDASEALYEQAQQESDAGNLETAIAIYEALLKQNPNFADARTEMEAARKQLARNQVKERLEIEYSTGLRMMKEHDWTGAILAFEKILDVESNYRDTRSQLNKARKSFERESTESTVARYYAEGIEAMQRNDMGDALAAFEKVRSIKPNYRDTATLLAEIESTLRVKPETEVPAMSAASLDSLYEIAVEAYKLQDWMPAVLTFEKLQLLQPDYKDVPERLLRARTNLNFVEQARTTPAAANGHSAFFYVGIVAVVMLPLVGMVLLSPTTRARFYLLQGNNVAAVRLY